MRPGIDDRPDLDKALSPEDKDAVARLAIKDRRRPPEASADQPEAQAVRLAAAGSSAAAAAAASVDAPAPDLSSAYLDMRDPMVAANGQRPTAVQISRLNWGFFVASILVGAPWAALNTIAMPNAVARLFDYDTASAISVTINPSTGRPLPVATIRARVIRARNAAKDRFQQFGWTCNAQASGTWLHANTSLKAMELVNRALSSQQLTLRGAARAMRLAWTLADLAGRISPTEQDVHQGIEMRTRVS